MYVYKEKRRQGHQIFLLLTFIFFCFHDCMIPCASFNLIAFIILVYSDTSILLKGHREYMYYDIRLENLFSQLVTLLCSCFRLHRLYLPTQFLYAVKFFCVLWRAVAHSFFHLHSHVVMQWHWAFFIK